MPWNNCVKILSIACPLFLYLGGCASPNPAITPPSSPKSEVREVNITKPDCSVVDERVKILPIPKEFTTSQEDLLIVQVLDALNVKDLALAKVKFLTLYEMTKKRDYLIEATKLGLGIHQSDDLIPFLEKSFKNKTDDYDVARLLVGCYMAKRDIPKIKSTLGAMNIDKISSVDALFVGDIYASVGEYDKALKAYKASYTQKPNETLLDKIGMILAEKQENVPEAISYYETHTRLYGCSKNLCRRLSALYAQVGDIENVIAVERKIFTKYKETQVANRVVSLYLAQNNIEGLIDFLKKSKFDDQILFEAYKVRKDYVNAAKIAMQLYEKSKDVTHLGEASILAFESGNKDDPLLIGQTVKNLRLVVAKNDDDLYANYLGYLLIDYNINLAEGIEWVKKALEKDNQNPAYLDSLAWGLFKQKKCKEAYEIMIKVRNQLADDKTVHSHFETIKKCYHKEIEAHKTLRDIIK